PLMNLVYFVSRKMFGKVVTPLQVVYARLPLSFTWFSFKISKLDQLLELPAETRMLIRERVARINVCLFCIDIGRSFTIKESMDEKKFDALDDYQTSPLFTDSDRAALDYVTELTRDKQVRPEIFARLARHFSERQICEIAWLVATEHYYNLVNIGLNIHSDMLCDLTRKNQAMAIDGARGGSRSTFPQPREKRCPSDGTQPTAVWPVPPGTFASESSAPRASTSSPMDFAALRWRILLGNWA